MLRLLSALHCSDHDPKKQVNSIRIIIFIDEKNIQKLTSKQPKCLVTLLCLEQKTSKIQYDYMRTGREKVPKDLLTPLTVTEEPQKNIQNTV